MTASIAIVPAGPEHHALILDSFWREYQESPLAKGVPPEVLTAKMKALLAAPSWRSLVATPQDDSNTILGYLVYQDRFTVGWVHVLRFWRTRRDSDGNVIERRGVARALLTYAGITPGVLSCPFLPPEVAKAATARGYVLRFRPYLPDVEMELAARRAADAMGVVG